MKKLSYFFGGLNLIAIGLFAYGQAVGYLDLDHQNPGLWIAVFAGLSLLACLSYFIAGVHCWGWLFLAGIFGAFAMIPWLIVIGIEGPILGYPLSVGIGLPCFVACLARRSRWRLPV